MKKKKSSKKLREAKARALEEDFYISVYLYILEEYHPKIGFLFSDSPISDKIVDLTREYYWGGNTVPNTAGDIADLLRSKYK